MQLQRIQGKKARRQGRKTRGERGRHGGRAWTSCVQPGTQGRWARWPYARPGKPGCVLGQSVTCAFGAPSHKSSLSDQTSLPHWSLTEPPEEPCKALWVCICTGCHSHITSFQAAQHEPPLPDSRWDLKHQQVKKKNHHLKCFTKQKKTN